MTSAKKGGEDTGCDRCAYRVTQEAKRAKGSCNLSSRDNPIWFVRETVGITEKQQWRDPAFGSTLAPPICQFPRFQTELILYQDSNLDHPSSLHQFTSS